MLQFGIMTFVRAMQNDPVMSFTPARNVSLSLTRAHPARLVRLRITDLIDEGQI